MFGAASDGTVFRDTDRQMDRFAVSISCVAFTNECSQARHCREGRLSSYTRSTWLNRAYWLCSLSAPWKCPYNSTQAIVTFCVMTSWSRSVASRRWLPLCLTSAGWHVVTGWRWESITSNPASLLDGRDCAAVTAPLSRPHAAMSTIMTILYQRRT